MVASMKRSGLVWSLLLCLVLVNGFMAAPSVDHAGHHAHHQAGTHATGLCAWFCGAGEGIETTSGNVESTLHPVDRVIFNPDDQHDLLFSLFAFLRGPPAPGK